MNNMELFKKLLTIVKQLHDKEDSMLKIYGVERNISSNEVDDLLDLGRELLSIEQENLTDEYYFITCDVLLKKISIKSALDKIEELII